MRIILLFSLLLWSEGLLARAIAVRFGPPSLGIGGSNPVGIPPDLMDIGVSYINDKGMEWNASVTAFSVAKREKANWGGYTSLGVGIVMSGVAVGFGPYAAFGYEGGCAKWIGCFTAEYNQGLGISSRAIISPYGVRLGVVRSF